MADTHLFSSEIGGNWVEESYRVFKDIILEDLIKKHPEALIFMGDTLDPHSGRSDPRWPRGDEASGKLIESLKELGINGIYALKGNHDYEEPMKLMARAGSPVFINNDWLKLDDTAFYFFTSRYPDLGRAEQDLRTIPDFKAKHKILLMHENICIEAAENLSKKVMGEIADRFDLVLNGHEHAAKKPYNNVYCLSSTLPWRAGYGNSDLEVHWGKQKEPEIKENANKFGYWLLDTLSLHLDFVPVDISIKIAVVRLSFSDSPVSDVRRKIIKISEILSSRYDPQRVIVRICLDGTLKEGDERIDVGFSELGEKYYSQFYEGTGDVFNMSDLKGGGAYLSKEDLSFVSIEDAVKKLKSEIPDIEEFYREVYDLIEKKSLDTETLIDRIKKSKHLGDKDEV